MFSLKFKIFKSKKYTEYPYMLAIGSTTSSLLYDDFINAVTIIEDEVILNEITDWIEYIIEFKENIYKYEKNIVTNEIAVILLYLTEKQSIEFKMKFL